MTRNLNYFEGHSLFLGEKVEIRSKHLFFSNFRAYQTHRFSFVLSLIIVNNLFNQFFLGSGQAFIGQMSLPSLINVRRNRHEIGISIDHYLLIFCNIPRKFK